MPPAYSQDENQYYSWLFALCDVNNDGIVGVETDKIWIHTNSGLESDVVDQVP